MQYVYFVAYAHTSGFGNIEITSPYLIESYESLKETQELIEGIGKKKGIIILNFQLLKIVDITQ